MRAAPAAVLALVGLLRAFPATAGEFSGAAEALETLSRLAHGRERPVVALPASAPSYPAIRVRYRADFLPSTTTVAQLMTPQGEVYLFRVIDRPYIPGFVGPFAREEGAVSYSLNPFIATAWDDPRTRNPGSTVLIARNSVSSGGLTFPERGNYVGMRYTGRLSPSTRLGEIAFLDEVKVPVGRENVLRAMPLAEFQRIAEGFGDGSFGLDELLGRVLSREPGRAGSAGARQFVE